MNKKIKYIDGFKNNYNYNFDGKDFVYFADEDLIVAIILEQIKKKYNLGNLGELAVLFDDLNCWQNLEEIFEYEIYNNLYDFAFKEYEKEKDDEEYERTHQEKSLYEIECDEWYRCKKL